MVIIQHADITDAKSLAPKGKKAVLYVWVVARERVMGSQGEEI